MPDLCADSALGLFNAGMDRALPNIKPIHGPGLNLGAGNKMFSYFSPMQLPSWDAEVDDIPRADNSQRAILAFHFLEHISSGRVPYVMSECQRVLLPGGTLNIVVPHRLGGMAWQDLDHKSFFTEDTWRILFKNDYYVRPGQAPFKMNNNFNLIMGQDERCLALVSQFTKG